MRTLSSTGVPSLPQRRAGRGTGRALRGAAEPRGEGSSAHTLSIADGTALRCGRVGSRHFQKPLGFVLGASLFVGVIIPFPRCSGNILPRYALHKMSIFFLSRSVALRENFRGRKNLLSSFRFTLGIYAEPLCLFRGMVCRCSLSLLCRVGARGVGRLPHRCPISAIGRCYHVSSPVFVQYYCANAGGLPDTR